MDDSWKSGVTKERKGVVLDMEAARDVMCKELILDRSLSFATEKTVAFGY